MIPEYIHYVGNILIDTIRYNRHRLMQPLWFSTLGLIHVTHRLQIILFDEGGSIDLPDDPFLSDHFQ